MLYYLWLNIFKDSFTLFYLSFWFQTITRCFCFLNVLQLVPQVNLSNSVVARWGGWGRRGEGKLWGCDETCCLINLTYEPPSTEQLCAVERKKDVSHRCLSVCVCLVDSTHTVSGASSTNNYTIISRAHCELLTRLTFVVLNFRLFYVRVVPCDITQMWVRLPEKHSVAFSS